MLTLMSNYEIDFWWWIHILHFKYVRNLPTLSLACFFFFHIEFRTMWSKPTPLENKLNPLHSASFFENQRPWAPFCQLHCTQSCTVCWNPFWRSIFIFIIQLRFHQMFILKNFMLRNYENVMKYILKNKNIPSKMISTHCERQWQQLVPLCFLAENEKVTQVNQY